MLNLFLRAKRNFMGTIEGTQYLTVKIKYLKEAIKKNKEKISQEKRNYD